MQKTELRIKVRVKPKNKLPVKGAIVIGYPGVGKSTVAKSDMMFVDLESSNFNSSEEEKIQNWHIPYCRLARDIASQGHVVFVSSHPVVIEQLKRLCIPDDINVAVCIPALCLKDKWIERLTNRCIDEISVKNIKALERAKEHFTSDILDLIYNNPFPTFVITEMDQDLREVLLPELLYINR